MCNSHNTKYYGKLIEYFVPVHESLHFSNARVTPSLAVCSEFGELSHRACAFCDRTRANYGLNMCYTERRLPILVPPRKALKIESSPVFFVLLRGVSTHKPFRTHWRYSRGIQHDESFAEPISPSSEGVRSATRGFTKFQKALGFKYALKKHTSTSLSHSSKRRKFELQQLIDRTNCSHKSTIILFANKQIRISNTAPKCAP